MQFVKEFNARTADQAGMIIPVVITVFADRSYSFITKTPPAAGLLLGSGEPNRNKVGTVSMSQVEEIAKVKMPDLNTTDLAAACRTVAGTARSMGLLVGE